MRTTATQQAHTGYDAHTLEILYRLNTQSETPNGIYGYRVCYAHRRVNHDVNFLAPPLCEHKDFWAWHFGSEIQINIHMDIIVILICCGTGLGIWYYWVRHTNRRSQARARTLELIRNAPRPKTHYEAWEDDYMGRG